MRLKQKESDNMTAKKKDITKIAPVKYIRDARELVREAILVSVDEVEIRWDKTRINVGIDNYQDITVNVSIPVYFISGMRAVNGEGPYSIADHDIVLQATTLVPCDRTINEAIIFATMVAVTNWKSGEFGNYTKE